MFKMLRIVGIIVVVTVVLVIMVISVFQLFKNNSTNENESISESESVKDIVYETDVTYPESPIDEDEHIEDWNTFINEVPSDEYILYPGTCGKPVSAVLYKNGEEIEISVDDPRLIRLLNMYNNSIYHEMHGYSQGPVNELYDEFITAEFRLELFFDDAKYGYNFERSANRVIVTVNEFYIIRDHIPFEEYDFSCFSRVPYFENGGCSVNWLELVGF